MIGYLEGTLFRLEEERLLLLAQQVGYEILLPTFVRNRIGDLAEGDPLALFIYYHQTERQPRPILIGFTSEAEKSFFQSFLSVEAIGPLKAVKALDRPVTEIAAAIENNDLNLLKQLKGIGARTAQKIIATLGGKMDRFVHDGRRPAASSSDVRVVDGATGIRPQVIEVLTSQLGYKLNEARQLVDAALDGHSEITTAEALLDAVLRSR
ncbi:MAG: OB-fold domain-containing protein [Desulfosarcinaceae bacterium]|nr:OB-fold domain-containing protein [Desulfosarcinaceae bacterium]